MPESTGEARPGLREAAAVATLLLIVLVTTFVTYARIDPGETYHVSVDGLPGGLGCRLEDATDGNPAAMRTALSAELGVSASVKGSTLTVRAGAERRAWSAGAFAVAKAEQYGATSVTVGSRTWRRTTGADGWEWKAARTPAAKGTAVVTFAG